MFKSYAGSVPGPYRDGKESDNQDSYSILEDDVATVLCVADGLGSHTFGGEGAKIAANTAVSEARDALDLEVSPEDAVRVGVEQARIAILDQPDANQMGCTLALAVITEEGWAVGIVGDSFAVVTKDTDNHVLIARPQDDEYRVNVTKILTSKDYDPLYVSGDDKIIGVSVSTDGLYSTSTREREASNKFWEPLIRRAREDNLDLQKFFYYMNDNNRVTDDSTLVMAVELVQEDNEAE